MEPLAPAESKFNPQAGKYLVCVDKSDESRIALRLACIKARNRGGIVSILHAVQPVDVHTLHSIADKMREEMRLEAETLMQKLSAEAFSITGMPPVLLIREGQAGDEILNAALEDHDINMLVLGVMPQSSGRGKLVTWLATQLGNKLQIPLLLVPGNLTDQQLEMLG